MPIDAYVRDALLALPETAWIPAVDATGRPRDGAFIAEATGWLATFPASRPALGDLPPRTPPPRRAGALHRHRGPALPGVVTDQPDRNLTRLELRHRQHARVEDRIRQAKATGLANLPCHRSDANAAWLEIIFTATDLVAWTKLIGFTEHRDLATCEIETFRYRVLHVAAQITRGARQIRLRIDATWRWATAISQGWQRLRAAFT